MKRMVFATSNQRKVGEAKLACEPLGIEIVSRPFDIDETKCRVLVTLSDKQVFHNLVEKNGWRTRRNAFLLLWERDDKSRSHAHPALCGDLSAVPIHNFFTDREADSSPLILIFPM